MGVKYSTIAVDNTIKTNNIVITNGTGDYGSLFWTGITPPDSGYTIYNVGSGSQSPNIVVAKNDAGAIFYAKSFGGTGINTIGDALAYLSTGSTGTTIVNMDYPGIVTSGLTVNLDAGFVPSFPRKGSTWYNLSSNSYNGTVTGGTFSTEASGVFTFNGHNPATIPSSLFSTYSSNFTVSLWINSSAGGYVIGWGNGGASPYYQWMLYIQTQLWFAYYNGANSFLSGSTIVPLSTWTQITATVNTSGQIGLYVNTTGSTSNGTITPIKIRTDYNRTITGYPIDSLDAYYNGKMACIHIYNRILSADEIAQNYNAMRSRFGV
jgi:hypothetical protein